ncbi:hypothetical protein PENANT_c073G06444 [Penicillium antarcticum]|uniref:DUF7779 domain-containing protein n=1 Tax=Penicillium antarcticum TaxID=416450 RepID=A0A1V6PPG7_9EURO|nr:hypothetical protein PENANT_c073G06444 [Penicillium antarcticum]
MASTSHSGVNYGAQVGINYGTFTADFHLPPERPETPPSPLSTVPFTRDPDFVRRNKLLQWIHDKSSVPGLRIALFGLGGVGKSQLAIEYSYQVRSESPATWVLWVHASNQARLEQSFRDIADQVKIPGRQDPKVNIFSLVESRLRDEKKGKWICILDNVDDDKFLCSFPATGEADPIKGPMIASTKPLLEYIPRSRNGFTIITSRTREVALRMVDHRDLIEVQPMESSEALELLQKKLEYQGEIQETQQLVNALEFMPLAIVQAASYIRNRTPRYSVSQYLRSIQGSDRDATNLLKKEAGHLSRDWEANNSILVTWQISFDYIRQTKPSAADLLALMSFFDRQGIPENLLRLHTGPKCKSSLEPLNGSSDGETSESDMGPDFEDDITTLRDYSFISCSEESTFTMHRLVQLTTRAWLKAHGQTDQWRDNFISNLCDEFPTGRYEDWERCRPLFPHVKSAMSHRPKSFESLRQWATLLYRGAWYASRSGNIVDAREMASRSGKERAILLGEEHEECVDSISMVASICWLEGRWQQAEQLFMQVMETRKAKLGNSHLDTLTSITNLAATYRKQCRWEKAEQLQVQVMATLKTKFGEDDTETLSSMSNLAATYQNQGLWQKAELLHTKVLETRKLKLGEDHPDTLSSMANLVLAYHYQSRWEEAEVLHEQVIETRKIKLGENHPDTLTSIHNMASTYLDQGRWAEAELLFIRVINTRKTMLGKDHPDTLTSMANLALTYSYQDRWEEAELLHMQVLEIRKAKLGEDHSDSLTSAGNLALVYWDQGRWEEAEQLEVHVLETSKKALGVDHPDTLTRMANLALTFWNQGRWAEAEQLEVQVMDFRKTKLGEDHPDTLTSMANLAFTWKSSGHTTRALHLLRDCVTKQKQMLGGNHHQTLSNSETLLEWETEGLNIKT